MDLILSGIPHALQPINLIIVSTGVFLGIIFGALPGIGPPLALALLLPMMYSLDPVSALFLIAGIYNGSIYGGSITAILINTPGTPASAATILDGYPMSQKGEAGKALGASIGASFVGGIVSTLIFISVAIPLADQVLKFGPSQLFLVILFALASVSRLSEGSLPKALIATCVGLLMGLIGFDMISGHARFTFGATFLEDGMDLLAVLIGWFAIAELMFLIQQKTGTISDVDHGKGGVVEGALAVLKFPATVIKSSFIGGLFGAIPGIGAAAANFIAYAEAKKGSKHPERFGKGYVEGVIAPEAANNAVTGTSLITTLVLGIPGNASAAVMLGALMILGLQPGASLFTETPDIMGAFMVGLILANVFMLVMVLLMTNLFKKVTTVKISILVPIILAMCYLGSFAARFSVYDVIVAIIVGVVTYGLRKANYPIICMVLGFMLARMLEENYHQAMLVSNNGSLIFLQWPINTIIIICGLLLFLGGPLMKLIRQFLMSQKEAN
ncbi:MAG TPA: tripartite tricarboxylate transporter permease [Clostridia bacterium]|nr:tripartite tricarboxylate transporter permease [Clostridia bacterium]